MTLKIEIIIDPRDKDDTLDAHLSAIGFKRAAIAPSVAAKLVAEAAPKEPASVFAAFRAAYPEFAAAAAEALDTAEETVVVNGEPMPRQEAEARGDIPAREPGKPKLGCKRRTNAEIAEDEAFFAAQACVGSDQKAAEAREAAWLDVAVDPEGSREERIARLCERLDSTPDALADPSILSGLRRSVLDQVAIDQPSYSAYQAAIAAGEV